MSNPIIKAEHLVEYQNLADEVRALIALAADGTGVNSITNNVGYWNAAGAFTQIFNPSVGASDPRMVASRDYGFFVDGITADKRKWNIDAGLSKWGIEKPTVAPTVASSQSTSNTWRAATEYTTLGLLRDSVGNIQWLQSINANSTNPSSTATIGTSGKGDPTWNQTPGGTTTDGAITWTNRGPIGLWQANHFFSEGHFGFGTVANPAIVFDPGTNSVYFNNQGGGGTSGSDYPGFIATVGAITIDGTVRWEFLGNVGDAAATSPGTIHQWIAATSYFQWGATNNFTRSAVTEPASVPNAYDTVTGQFKNTIFLQSDGTAGFTTSSASFANPVFATTSGGVSTDNQLEWMCLGSATRANTAAVTKWVGAGVAFSAIFDGANFQVCVKSGTTAGSPPTFATTYGAQTSDGTAVWACVGELTSWVANTDWFYQIGGFSVPTSTASYGGAGVLDTNNDIERVVQSGKSGAVQPTWNGVGQYTKDGGTPFVLTSVAVVGAVTTYNGTITGGAANAFAGHNFLIEGFTIAGNNGFFLCTASTATTLVFTTSTQANETHAGTAAGNDTGSIIWFNVEAVGAVAGNVVLIKGRQYFLVFYNPVSGHISDLSPVSNSSGALASGSIFVGNLQVSSDPQVTKKILLATADGGDQTTLYFVALLDNSTLTYTDTTEETILLAGNIYQETDAAGIDHGVADNALPPDGSFPIKYRGRLYMLVGSFLFFSKSLADLTTSTGIIAGRYEEAWPADFQMDISEGAEVGRGLFTDGFVLYIGTQRHIRRLTGDGPANFGSPEVIFNEVGINNQDVWQAIFLEGTPAGAMWLTPDFRVIRSDFNTYNNVGTTIQTTLNSINAAAANTCWASYVGIDGYNFYVLGIPTGSHTEPDTFCIYNIATGRWFIWTLADLLRCGIFYLNLAGVPRFIVNANDGSIYAFDPTVSLDRATGVDRTGIASIIKTVFTDMNDATLRKALNEVEVATTQKKMKITIEGASSIADFGNPTVVIFEGVLTENIFGELKLFLAGLNSQDRFYRMTITDTSDQNSTVNDELLSYYSFEAIPLHRN